MNSSLRIHYNIFFIAYISIWLGYVFFLSTLFSKTIPGFLMQILFLIETIRGGYSVLSLMMDDLFIQSVLGGTILLALMFLFSKGIYRSGKDLVFTYLFRNRIEVVERVVGIKLIGNSSFEVFTGGLLRPEVFISKELYYSLDKEQLNAVLLHEQSHIKDFDNLKSFVIRVVNNTLFPFPFKKDILKFYNTVTELKCDLYAQQRIGDSRPLINALHSIISSRVHRYNYSLIKMFVDVPDRLQILLGERKLNSKFLLSISLVFISTAIVLPLIAYNANFYNCEYIIECITRFVYNVSQSSTNELCSDHIMIGLGN